MSPLKNERAAVWCEGAQELLFGCYQRFCRAALARSHTPNLEAHAPGCGFGRKGDASTCGIPLGGCDTAAAVGHPAHCAPNDVDDPDVGQIARTIDRGCDPPAVGREAGRAEHLRR